MARGPRGATYRLDPLGQSCLKDLHLMLSQAALTSRKSLQVRSKPMKLLAVRGTRQSDRA
jgi:hypothetical protein